MTVFGHHDFELDRPDDGAPAPLTPPREPEPLIVVEYRDRWFSGLLVPPALILAAAAVFLTYRPDLATIFGQPRMPRPAPRPEPAAGSEAPAPPIVLEVKTLPSPDVAEPEPHPSVADEMLEPPPLVADETLVEEADRPPADDPGSQPDPAPVVAPEAAPILAGPPEPDAIDPQAEAREAREAILREAERIRAEQARFAVLRAREAEVDRLRQLEAEKARQRQAEEARRLAQQGREAFRQELLRALRLHGDRAGPRILRIAERHHVEPGSSVELAIKQALEDIRPRKLGRSERVALLRAHGLPEPLILGDLIHLEERRKGSSPGRVAGASHGVRIDYGAVVRAARQLLAIPTDPPPTATTHTALLPGRLGP